jgi:ribosomal-protein-alanine N-acetyltransferase
MSAQVDSITSCRTMTDADLDRVASIEQSVHAHPWTRGNFADSINAGYHCWVVMRGRELVAYGVEMIAAGEAHLLNVSVAPGHQRRGIGSELVRFFVKLAREHGADKIYLEVRPSNTAARALYAEHGFVESGVRRDYYPAGDGREDAVVMEMRLR